MESKYNTVIDLANTNNAHTIRYFLIKDRLELCHKEKPRLLDIGCADGCLDEALLDLGLYIVGIDPDCDVETAKSRMSEFHNVTFDEYRNIHNGDKFDFIMMGDVLEHIPNPEACLRSVLELLEDDGKLIISVPNITHCDIMAMLADGQFRYTTMGILDRTHVNFYSQWGIRDLMIKCGLGIEEFKKVRVPFGSVYPVNALLDNNIFSDHINSDVFQFALCASKEAFKDTVFGSKPPQKILIMTPVLSGSCYDFRLKVPYGLYAYKHNAEIKYEQLFNQESVKWSDLVVILRDPNPESLKATKYAFKYGIPVIFEIDDLLYELPENLGISYSIWQMHNVRQMILYSDRVTTTTPRLKNNLHKYSDNVNIVRNILPGETVSPENMHDNGPVTLIMCSSGRLLNPIGYRLFEEISKKRPNVKLHIIGDFLINDSAEYSFSATRSTYISMEELTDMLKKNKNSICIIPLNNSLFSSCKSEIKFVHFTKCGTPCIMSNVPPYSDVITNGKDGLLLDDDLGLWVKHTLELIDSQDKRISLLNKGLKLISENYTEEIVISQLEELFKELPVPDKSIFDEKITPQQVIEDVAVPEDKRLIPRTKKAVKKIIGTRIYNMAKRNYHGIRRVFTPEQSL